MNVKQGDLAIFIYRGSGTNAGKIVEVCEFVPAGSAFVRDGRNWKTIRPGWWVKSSNGLIHSVGRFFHMEGVVADLCLRPVSGLPDTETIDEQEPLKEIA